MRHQIEKTIPPELPPKDRSAVQRRHAPTYLLIILLSFAFSVTATRVFLNLTGFPQIGGGGLHIAHVLWGGLFLFIASLIPLILVNQWALRLSSILAGIGVGLFIDEVGKFITSNNNYFYPTAAPIIYGFFLLTVLIYLEVRHRPEPNPRAQMYAILEDFAEVLDRDLSEREYQQLKKRLQAILQTPVEDQLASLAKSLLSYLNQQKGQIVPDHPGRFERAARALTRFEEKYLPRARFRWLLIAGLLIWAVWAVISQVINFSTIQNPIRFEVLLHHFTASQIIWHTRDLILYQVQIFLEASMGVLALAAVFCFFFKDDKAATWIGIVDLLITLVIVNLITFYYNQFSTIAFAVYQFILLILILTYRRRYLLSNSVSNDLSKP